MAGGARWASAGRRGRAGLAVFVGAASHVGLLLGGFGLWAWENSRLARSCGVEGCEPPAYITTAMMYFLVLLPVTFMAGSAAVGTAWAWALRPEPFSMRRRVLVRVWVSLVAAPVIIGLVAVGTRRMAVFIVAVLVAPVLGAALAGVGSMATWRAEPVADSPGSEQPTSGPPAPDPDRAGRRR